MLYRLSHKEVYTIIFILLTRLYTVHVEDLNSSSNEGLKNIL